MASKKFEVSDTTYAFYRGKTNTFLRFLGERADRAAFEISTEDIRKWRDSESERVSATTVNHSLKFLRVFFGAAKKDGLIADNPATDIPILKIRERTTRRPFTLKEIRSLLAVAEPEWKSLIIFGLYTGQRLGDIATLTWDQIDLKNREILLTTRKTSRNQKIPMTAPLVKHIKALRKSGRRDGAVHTVAEEIYRSQGRAGTLSRQFHELMAEAGIVEKKRHAKAKNGQGRDGNRAASKISFHSLRHTTTSLLKNAGVSPAVTEEFVGHDSVEINRVYTHIELDSMKKAAALLPDVT